MFVWFLPARRYAMALSVCLSVCLFVCPFVISRCCTKAAKRRITKTTQHNSPGLQFHEAKDLDEIAMGTGAPNAGRVCKNCVFDRSKSLRLRRFPAENLSIRHNSDWLIDWLMWIQCIWYVVLVDRPTVTSPTSGGMLFLLSFVCLSVSRINIKSYGSMFTKSEERVDYGPEKSRLNLGRLGLGLAHRLFIVSFCFIRFRAW